MTAKIGIIMGSRSDWDTMKHASETLDTLNVEHEIRIVSAHRTPDLLFDYAASAVDRRPAGDHRGCRRRCAFAGHGSGKNAHTGVGRAGAVEGPQRHGLATFHRRKCRAAYPWAAWRSAKQAPSMPH